MAVLNESAHKGLTFDVNINDAKAIRDIRNFKREMHDLVRDYNSEASRLESLGNKTQSDEVKLKGTTLQVDKLKEAVKDLRQQVKAGYTNGADIEKQKKINHLLSEMESKLRNAEGSQKLLQQRVILFNTELGNLNRTIESTSRAAEQHIQVLQASGRETESLKVKTTSYKNELWLLEKQQKAQMKSLEDYRETLRKNNHYSQDELNEALKLDANYQKAKSFAEDTNLRMAKVKNGLNDLTSGYEQARLKSNLYSKETDSLTNMIKMQTGTISSNIVELKRLSTQRKLDNDLIEAQTAKMKQIKQAVGENSEAYKRARIEQEKMIASASRNLDKEQKLSSKSNPASFMSEKTASKIDATNKGIDKYNRLANKASSVGHSLSYATLGVGSAFVIGAKNAAQLEDNFNKIQVLMTTGGEHHAEVEKNLNKLREESRKSSIKYGVSQDKIVSGYKEMTKRGYDSNQVLGSQKYFLQAAIASGDDYNDVVNNGSSALEGFGLKGKNAKEAAENTKKAMNQLSYAADLTATDFNSMGYAMGYVASTAHSADQSIGDTAGAIGVLSNNGIEASMAGTGLRKVLNSLATPTKNGVPALAQIGLSPKDFKDTHGNMLSLEDMMKKINEHTKGMASGDKLTLFHKIFGATGQEAALVLAKNANELGHLNKKIAESQNQGKDGYVANIAERNMNTAKSQLNRLKESGKALATSYAVTVLPAVSDIAKKAADFTNKMSSASPVVKGIFTVLATGIPTIAAGAFLLSGISKTIGAYKGTLNGLRKAFSWITGSNKKQASEIKKQTAEYKELTAAIKQNTKAKEINSGGSLDSGTGKSTFSNDTTIDKNGKKNKRKKKWFGRKSNKVSTAANITDDVEEVVEDSTESIGKNKKSSGIFRKLGTGSKSVASKLPYLDLAIAGSSLIGMNEKNAFSRTGGTGGAITGSALGAFGGPLGIAAGGVAGQWLGENIGKEVQKSVNKQVSKYTVDPTSKADKSTNGVASNLRNFNVNSDLIGSLGNDDSAKQMKKNLSQQNKEELKKAREELNKQATKVGNSGKNDVDLLNPYLINNSKVDSNKVARADKDLYDKRLKDADKAFKELAKSEGKGGKEREEALKKTNKAVAKLMTSSSSRQKSIMAQLTATKGKMSDKEAGKLIANSASIANSQIKDADKEYKNTKEKAESKYQKVVDAANRQYYDTKQISYSSYKEAIENATAEKNGSINSAKTKKSEIVKQAEKQKNQVVEKARQQTKDHLASVDEETGKSLGFWGRWGKRLKGVWQGVSDFFGQMWQGITSKMSSLSSSIGSKFKGTAIGKGAKETANGFKSDWNNVKKFAGGVGSWALGYADGGSIKKNQMALIGEKGAELAYNPKKNLVRVLGANGPEITKLFAGEHILDSKQTSKILSNGLGKGSVLQGYAKGTQSNNTDGVLGNISINLNVKSVKSAVRATQKGMEKVQKKIIEGYKVSNDSAEDAMNDLSDLSEKKWKNIESKTAKSTDNIHANTIDNVKTMVKDFGKIIDKIPGLSDKSMKGTVASLNKGVLGINESLKEFGGNTEVLKPIKYATGSNGKLVNDQLAMINDSPTDQKQEAVIRDNRVFLPKGDNRLLRLQTGDQVLNGRQTAKMMQSFGFSRFAGGSGVSDGLLKKIAKKNSKNPNDAYDSDFTTNVKIDGSSLEKSLTKSILNGMKPVGQDWTKSMWNLIKDTIDGGGSGSKGAFLRYAEKIGTDAPYVYGGFDCSKLIQDSLKHFGIDIGRDTVSQSNSNKLNSLGRNLNNAEVGDLAYFGSSGANAHVGIISDKDKRLMMNQHPPKGGISSLDTDLPLNGYYSVKGFHSNRDKKDGNKLSNLVQKQLGKGTLKWIKDTLGQKSDGGGVPRASGNRKNWLKQAGIAPEDYGYASEIAMKESSWNPKARNGQYYGIAQTTVDNYKKYGGPNWEYDPVGQLVTMRKYVENRYGSFANAIDFRRKHDWYKNGGLSTKHKMAEISEGNKPEMVIPLTNKSRSVELILKSLEFMFGNGGIKDENKKSSKSDANLIKALMKSNAEKDKKIDNILDKMDILISTIQNKPVLSEADIYKANKRQTQNQQRFNNLGKGAF